MRLQNHLMLLTSHLLDAQPLQREHADGLQLVAGAAEPQLPVGVVAPAIKLRGKTEQGAEMEQ